MRSTLLAAFFISAVFSGISKAEATEYQGKPSNYRQLFEKLQAGDTLTLAAGQYLDGLTFKNRHGTAENWIKVIGQGKDTVFLGKKGKNTIDILESSYIAIQNIKFDGQGLEVDAIKAGQGKGRPCHHVLIEGLIIVNHGAHQNIVGINTKAPCWDWIIRNNTISGAGTGLYLGNSDGRQPFIRGIIEKNLVESPQGYCMQIKHQIERPELKGIPSEASHTIIRDNVFIKNDQPSKHGDRPNLLVGGTPESGPGSKDRVHIYGNVFYHNPRESLFQGTGSLSIHDNIFIDGAKYGIRIQKHHKQAPKEVKIYHNTFFQVKTPYKVLNMAPKAPFLAAHNLILGQSRIPSSATDVAIFGKLVRRAVAKPSLKFGEMDFQSRGSLRPKKRLSLKKWLKGDIDSEIDFFKQPKKKLSYAGATARKYKQSRPILRRCKEPQKRP